MSFLHDIAYSHCGRRLATCGSDQRVSVWGRSASTGAWSRTASWAAHCGPVWRLAWAHPAFGAVLASASADGTVLLWEETASPAAAGDQWLQRAQLGDARGAVRALGWAPRGGGLRLAAGSADGAVRVYEAADAFASLAHWGVDSFDAEPEAAGGVAALAWSTSPADAALLAVGGGSGAVKVRCGAAARAAGPCGIVWCLVSAVAFKQFRPPRSRPAPQVWGWAAAARRWQPLLELRGHVRVADLAWAPAVGRAHDLLASCGSEGGVAVWRLQLAPPQDDEDEEQPGLPGGGGNAGGGGGSATPLLAAATAAADGRWSARRLAGAAAASAGSASLEAAFADAAPATRVEWNALGTVLASSGDDGVLRLRQRAPGGGGGGGSCGGSSGGWATAGELALSAPARAHTASFSDAALSPTSAE